MEHKDKGPHEHTGSNGNQHDESREPKRLPPHRPELYRPFGQQTLRDRVRELEAEQQLAAWDQPNDPNKSPNEGDALSRSETDSRKVQPYHVTRSASSYDSGQKPSQRRKAQADDDFYLDFAAEHDTKPEEPRLSIVQKHEQQKRRRELYRKRKRKRRILTGIALFFAVIILGGYLVLRYVTSGAQLGVSGSTQAPDFTLPPLGDDVPEGWTPDEEPTDPDDSLIVIPGESEDDEPVDTSDEEGSDVPDPTFIYETPPTEGVTPSPQPSQTTQTTQTLTLPPELYDSSRTWNKDVMNILLLGVDSRDMTNLNTRSDTMMVLTIDRVRNQLKLTSFQRDMLIFIPGHEGQGERKLNEGMYFGPQTSIAAINYYFNMDIDDFIVVNISGAEKIVDAVGGIRIDVPTDPEVLEYYNACIREQNWMMEPGNPENYVDYFDEGGKDILVNGRQAIAYARMRENDDYQRMGRQREVIMKLYEKMMDVDLLTLLNTIKVGFDQISTSYTLPDLLSLAVDLAPALSSEVEQMQVPVPGTFWEDAGDAWVNRVNFNLNIPLIHEFIYEEPLVGFDLVPVVSNSPPDLTDLREMPENLRWNPIPAGFHPVGSTWEQLRYVNWELPEDQTRPYWYFGPTEVRSKNDLSLP